jgi:hypothetical protein
LYGGAVAQSSKAAKDKWLAGNHHKRAAINRGWTLRKTYGITAEEYQAMIVAQNNKCAICHVEFVGVKEEPKSQRPHVDHNHDTRWVRGLLCSNCNFGIGYLKEDIIRMQSAIEYVIAGATPPEFVFTPVANPKRVYSEERKTQLREQWAGNKLNSGREPWNKGKAWSEDTKAKMSDSAKQRKKRKQ